MSIPVDDYTPKEVQTPGNSLYDSEAQYEDCVSENSFGSDFGDNATDEEESELTTADVDIDVDSLPPAYPDKEYLQSTFLLANMDLKKPPPLALEYAPPTKSTEPTLNVNLSGPLMCVVCKLSPAYSKGGSSYPTCGFTCASKMSNANVLIDNSKLLPQTPPQYTSLATSSSSASQIEYPAKQGSVKIPSQSRGSANQSIQMCDVCHIRPRFQKAGKVYPTCGLTCAAVLTSSPSPKGNVPTLDPLVASYQKLFLSDHNPGNLPSSLQSPRGERRGQHGSQAHSFFRSLRGSTRAQTTVTTGHPDQGHQLCVVCLVKPCGDGKYVTCGMKCAETLCKRGSANPRMCDYCHRRPKITGHNQCGKTCGNNASTACLLCRSRPRFGRYHLCGRTCYKIAMKRTPLILEARPGHTTYHEVEKRFQASWKGSSTSCPPIKKIYKIIENKSFLLPYDQYKRQIGQEVFRYHGTSRSCTLGSQGNTRLCSSKTCALCSILRTSFKVSLAKSSGAFGAGVYTSSASNKAYSYSHSGTGAIILTKVVLGTVYKVQAWNQVTSCPPGYNSVVFDRQNGTLNETVIYTDDAIRPVFLIIF